MEVMKPNPINDLAALARLVAANERFIASEVSQQIQDIIRRIRDHIDWERAERRRVIEGLEFKIRDLEGENDKLNLQLDNWRKNGMMRI